jgi:hypothetical protein
MTDYNKAKQEIIALNQSHPSGSLVAPDPGLDDALMVLVHALDSEDLSRHTVVMDPDSREFWMMPQKMLHAYQDPAFQARVQTVAREAFPLRQFSQAHDNPVTFDRTAAPDNAAHAGAVVRHYKGGIYSILAILGARSIDPKVLYVSHADGTAWIRPWSEFGDGRFDPSSETVLSLDEAGVNFS